MADVASAASEAQVVVVRASPVTRIRLRQGFGGQERVTGRAVVNPTRLPERSQKLRFGEARQAVSALTGFRPWREIFPAIV